MFKKKVEREEKKYTQEDAEKAFAEYANAEFSERFIRARLNTEVAELTKKYQPGLDKCAEEKARYSGIVEAFAAENKAQFADKRSIETPSGSFGFRKGTPKLALLDGMTWDEVKKKVKKLLPRFILTIEDVDKKGLLAARNAPEAAIFGKLGIEVVADETFFLKVKE